MFSAFRARPTYANVMASIALFVANVIILLKV